MQGTRNTPPCLTGHPVGSDDVEDKLYSPESDSTPPPNIKPAAVKPASRPSQPKPEPKPIQSNPEPRPIQSKPDPRLIQSKSEPRPIQSNPEPRPIQSNPEPEVEKKTSVDRERKTGSTAISNAYQVQGDH